MTETDSQPIAENEQVKELLALLKDNNTCLLYTSTDRCGASGVSTDG